MTTNFEIVYYLAAIISAIIGVVIFYLVAKK